MAPIARLRLARTVFAETETGTLVLPAAVDYVWWTERVAGLDSAENASHVAHGAEPSLLPTRLQGL